MQLERRGPRRSAPASTRRGLTGPGSSDGFAAHRALFAAALGLGVEGEVGRRTEVALPPLPPSPVTLRVQDPRHSRTWDAAVAEHVRLAGIATAQAEEAIVALAEHLERAARLTWAADPDLFAIAVEECLRFSIFDAGVSSAAAQQAWCRWWSEQPYGPSVGPRDAVTSVRSGADRERVLRSDWATAWAVWAARARLAR